MKKRNTPLVSSKRYFLMIHPRVLTKRLSLLLTIDQIADQRTGQTAGPIADQIASQIVRVNSDQLVQMLTVQSTMPYQSISLINLLLQNTLVVTERRTSMWHQAVT